MTDTRIYSNITLEELPEVKQELREILRQNICIVTFTKLNGDERVMHCTLRPELLPLSIVTESESNKTILSVWDTVVDDWRSFRINSIKQILIANV